MTAATYKNPCNQRTNFLTLFSRHDPAVRVVPPAHPLHQQADPRGPHRARGRHQGGQGQGIHRSLQEEGVQGGHGEVSRAGLKGEGEITALLENLGPITETRRFFKTDI